METVIEGWVASNGKLGMVAYLNGGIYSVFAPDSTVWHPPGMRQAGE